MYGFSSIEEFSNGLGTIFRQDSLQAFKEHLIFRIEGGSTFELDNVVYTSSGKRLHVHVRACPAINSGDSWERINASVTDITQRRNAETLREGQQRVLESLATVNSLDDVLSDLASELERQSPDIRAAVFQVPLSGDIFQKIASGTTAEEIVTLIDSIRVSDFYGESEQHSDINLPATGHPEHEIKHGGVLVSTLELVSRAISACGYECGILKPATGPDGRLLGVLAVFHISSAQFSKHEQEVISCFSDLVVLILQRAERSQTLNARTDELQTVFENYPDALLRISSDGRIQQSYSGHELTEYLSLSKEPSEQILWHLLPSEVTTEVRTAIDKVAAGQRQETLHFSVERHEGRREFEIRFFPLPSTTEQIAILRDVTQLKKAELKLKHASERFRYLFDNSPDSIFVESLDGFVLDANQAACDLHKLSRDQLIGQNVLSLIHPSDRDAARKRSSSLASGEISEFESRSLQSDGQIVPVGVRISTITYDDAPAVLLHVRDITQQKNEQEQKREQDRQLAHVSRLTMMGQLVAGIAHEIRQPLWSLSTFADVCVESLRRPDFVDRISQIRDVAGKIVSESRRVNAITTRMFSFARNGGTERTTCNIGDLANEAVELMAGKARSSRLQTTLRVDPDIPSVLCDRILR